ncbi:MAG: TIGR00266 family protein [Oscillatoriales cyanobacterium RM1_1_9]|nr:TIGR00266 family protein [Oscillatoriales cyanobacterium SM2_3_0]NJO44920.1 TIGR00266 family protein [Oscillatoriales cyanobacterium RM2_1_1]NJO70767.1 TIGR00266 family protein [Oscillatoriales cyanobacterium RM1_1_9]
MEIEILQRPDCAIAKIKLAAREELIAEAGTMVAMSDNINASTTLRQGKGGGVLGGLKRLVAGESLFLSVFRSPVAGEEIFLAPKFLGDIVHYPVPKSGLVVQASSYLASSVDVDIDLGFQGFKSLLSGESIFWLNISGQGDILLSSFGAIYEIDVEDAYIVDTGHIVAFEKSLNFKITKPGSSWLGTFLGGEGFVCRFEGRGKVFCQTHNPAAFGRSVGPMLPAR